MHLNVKCVRIVIDMINKHNTQGQNMNKELKNSINNILDKIKKETFVDGYKASNEEAFGILMSKYFNYDGIAIAEATLGGLTDSNSHSLAESLRVSIGKEKESWGE